MPLLQLGLRVVRGPSWKHGQQDGGIGCVGTVAEIQNNRISVIWDVGGQFSYSFDNELRAYDAGTIGIIHLHVQCDACKENDIKGFRWKCADCPNYDLCNVCYHKGQHDLKHSFHRIDQNGAQRSPVGTRHGSSFQMAYGLFIGAKVKRGPHWNWGNQDGGVGKIGVIQGSYDWKESSLADVVRTGAKVLWDCSTVRAEYRICFKGKCDLTAVQKANGGYYYVEHLPALDENCLKEDKAKFVIGENVCVYVSKEDALSLQAGHGGWSDAMEPFIGRIGKVSKILPTGDIGVVYPPQGPDVIFMLLATKGKKQIEWVYNPACLKKVEKFEKDDHVIVLSNQKIVQNMQEFHGGWIDPMSSALGKTGIVDNIDKDGDVRVRFGGLRWTFSPAALSKTTPKSGNVATDKMSTLLAGALFEQLGINEKPGNDGDETIITAAALGNLDKVKSLLNEKSSLVDYAYDGKTALQLACHKGNVEIVKVLLSNGADINKVDDDGDSPLHYAVIGDELEVVRLLVGKGAMINKQNNKQMTALHIAAYKGSSIIIMLLMSNDAEINTQDENGDTPLHDAITQDKTDAVELLINGNIDFTLVNKRGFNPLHHAVLTGKDSSVCKILEKVPELVNVQKEDGFAALHLAVINGHEDIAHYILEKGFCEVDKKTSKGQTPLMLAAQEGYIGLVKLLVKHGASLNATDEDGDTCLHVVLKKHHMIAMLTPEFDASSTMDSAKIIEQFEKPKTTCLVLACYLVQKSADLDCLNNEGKKAFDVIEDAGIKSLLAQFKEDYIVNRKFCLNCKEELVDARFLPCAHEIVCQNCVEIYRLCLKCKTAIQNHELFVPLYLPVCKNCEDNKANVVFLPCKHMPYCQDCSVNSKKCIDCSKKIEKRRIIGPKREEKEDVEDPLQCKICLDARTEVVFQCGHGCCRNCRLSLKNCHMCRQTITEVVPCYIN